jgi:hypothetical protein
MSFRLKPRKTWLKSGAMSETKAVWQWLIAWSRLSEIGLHFRPAARALAKRFNQRERKVFLCLFLLDCLSARDKTVAGCSHPAWPKTCGKDSQSQALKNKGRQLFADGFTLRAKG